MTSFSLVTTTAPKNPRGYILILVLMLVALISIGLGTLLFKMQSSGATSNEILARKRVFYEADGMARSAIRLADAYLRSNGNDTTGVKAYLESAVVADTITPAGYEREIFTVDASLPAMAAIPNGPYVGMNSKQYPVTVKLRLRNTASNAASEMASTIILGQLSAFQFFLFSEGYTDFFPFPAAAVRGRSHVNGDFCLSGKYEFVLEAVTASGRIMHMQNDNRCRDTASDRVNLHIAKRGSCPDFPTTAEIISGSGYTCTFIAMANNKDSGCAAGTCGTGWIDYARATWNGSVADGAHGIVNLKLPISGAPKVHAGINAGAVTASTITAKIESNRDKSRLLVDPMLPTEPLDVAGQKMMYKADIRIINGIWYLRDNDNPREPGFPVWSDHPGQLDYSPVTDGIRDGTGATGVGQKDIKIRYALNRVPRMFSYYPTHLDDGYILDERDVAIQVDKDGDGTKDGPLAVVSYGTLARFTSGSLPRWIPGARVAGNSNANNDLGWCQSTAACAGSCQANPAWNKQWVVDATNKTCGGAVDHRSGLLRATQSGIRDGHTPVKGFKGDKGTGIADLEWRMRRAKLLPMNFDVAVFQAALNNTDEGELGWHFQKLNRSFNGIVYITNTWPDQLTNMSTTADTMGPSWPLQGDEVDLRQLNPALVKPWWDTLAGGGLGVTQQNRHDRIVQNALPYNMCSSSLAPTDGSVDKKFDRNDNNNRYVIPDCKNYATTQPNLHPDDDTDGKIRAFVNAVRLVNAAKINPTSPFNYGHVRVPAGVLPKGLTIITNLPMFNVGEWNTSSDPESTDPTKWVPTLVGGDVIYHLSNSWDDAPSNWNDNLAQKTVSGTDTRRASVDTRYNQAILAGWAVTDPDGNPHGGGIQNFTRYLETWNKPSGGDTVHHITGSLLVGFASTFMWSTVDFGTYGFGAPERNWAYDTHFDSLENQPPGAPEYTVQAIKSWKKD